MSNVPRSLTVLVYGESGVGKSSFAATAPYPKLMLDVEAGHRFLPINVKYWDPFSEAPPVADGTWDTAVVNIHDYNTVNKVYEWLRSGQHQFRSLIVDSISELQVKFFDQIAGDEQIKMQQWGEVLRKMGNLLRAFRDLTTHPTNPLEAVVLTAMLSIGQDGVKRPYLQGALKTQVPYLFDIIGALAIETFNNPDPTQPPYKVRRMYVERTPEYEAKERVHGKLGSIIEQSDLHVELMLDKVFGPRVQTLPTAPAEPEVVPPATPTE